MPLLLFLILTTTTATTMTVIAHADKRPAAPARLRVMIPLEPSAAFDTAFNDAVKAFNANHPKHQVELIKGGSPFQSLRAIISAHYANDLPDLALINSADLPTLMELGIVQGLPIEWVRAKKVNSAFLGSMKCDSGYCSLPFQRRVPMWFFNRELLFKLSQETDRIPSAWPKLSALSHKLSKQGEIWGLAVPQSGESAITRWTALGFPQSPSADAIADWLLKLWDTPAALMPGRFSPEESTRLFLEQRAVILLGALDQIAFLKNNAAFRLGMSLPDGDLSWFGTDFVVLTKSQTAVSARSFLDYIYRPDVSLKLFRTSTTLPITRSQGEDSAWKKELEAIPSVKTALARKIRPLALERIAPQLRDEIASIVWEAVEQVPEASQRTLKEAEIKTRLQKKLSTNPR